MPSTTHPGPDTTATILTPSLSALAATPATRATSWPDSCSISRLRNSISSTTSATIRPCPGLAAAPPLATRTHPSPSHPGPPLPTPHRPPRPRRSDVAGQISSAASTGPIPSCVPDAASRCASCLSSPTRGPSSRSSSTCSSAPRTPHADHAARSLAPRDIPTDHRSRDHRLPGLPGSRAPGLLAIIQGNGRALSRQWSSSVRPTLACTLELLPLLLPLPAPAPRRSPDTLHGRQESPHTRLHRPNGPRKRPKETQELGPSRPKSGAFSQRGLRPQPKGGEKERWGGEGGGGEVGHGLGAG